MTRAAILAVLAYSLASFGQADTAPAIGKLKRLYPETALVKDGAPRSLIVIPDAPDYLPLAKGLQSAIRKATGATVAVRRASRFVDENWRIDFGAVGPSTSLRTGARNVMALGNVNNNRLLSVLCGEKHVVADSIYPGKGGHVVRTVHDPFANGVNVLVLAGSDRDGVAKAVAVFTSGFIKKSGRDLVVPRPVVDVDFKWHSYRFLPRSRPPFNPSSRSRTRKGGRPFAAELRKWGFMDAGGRVIPHRNRKLVVTALTRAMARMGEDYFRTGDPALPPLIREVLDKNRHLLNNPDHVHGMDPRTAAHIRQWDLLEELPVWTDRDRLAITNALLRDAMLGHERRKMHKQVREGCVQVMDENHGTYSARDSYRAWRYFDKYYPTVAPEQRGYWMRLARACYAGQCSTFQVLEDSARYLAANILNAQRYALDSRDLTYYRRGIAREKARYIALVCVNNVGLMTGFGDSPGLEGGSHFGALARAAWFHRDPQLYWILRNAWRPTFGRRIFRLHTVVNLDVKPQPPAGPEWTGLIRFPIYQQPLGKGQGSKTIVFAPKRSVGDGVFNKIVFKENWRTDGQYLLLDGAGGLRKAPGPSGHSHSDINTIINFTALGRMWLVDHSYPLRAFHYHSGVIFARNGVQVRYPSKLAELLNMMETPELGVTRTRSGDWDRTIVWRKERCFLILDRVRAARDGEYFARCALKTLGDSQIKQGSLLLSQAGRYCSIATDGQAQLDVQLKALESQKQWKAFYPHAKPTAGYFQQDKLRRLRKGESLGFASLLYPYASPADADAVTMRHVGEHCALITDRGRPTLVALDAAPGVEDRADVFVVSDDAAYALGCREMFAGLVTADGPCDLGIDFARKRLIAHNRAKRRIAAAGASRLTLEPGAHVLALEGWSGFGRAAEWRDRVIASARARRSAPRSVRAPERRVRGFALETVKLDMPVNRLALADLDGDGRSEWLAAGSRGARAYRANGKRLWAFPTTKAARALAVGDVDGDPAHAGPEVAVGCDDEKVYLLDRTGKLLWSFQCKRTQDSRAPTAAVDSVWIEDLEGDGKPEIIAGASWVHALTPDGKVKWERLMLNWGGRLRGGFRCGAIKDLDGDGVEEVIAAYITSYPLMFAYDTKGRTFFPVRKEREYNGAGGQNVNTPISVTAVDLFGGKKEKQIVLLGAECLRAYWLDHGKREYPGPNLSDCMVDMAVYQPDPNKQPTIFVATEMTTVAAFGKFSTRKERRIVAQSLWRKTIGEKITALLAVHSDSLPNGALYVGAKSGNVRAFNVADGSSLAEATLNGARVISFIYDKASRSVLAVKSDGAVVRLRLTKVKP